MKKFLLLLYTLYNFVIFQTLSLNIGISNPIIYLDQTKYLRVNRSTKSSFFGLTVILYPGDNINTPWIQIAAPRGNSPNVRYSNPGVIFRCRIGGLCEHLDVDHEFGQTDSRNGIYFNKLDDAWIGGAMDINLMSNRTVVCAPRWINYYRAYSHYSDYRMLGACYWSHINTKTFYKKLPLFDNSNDIYTDLNTGYSIYNYGQGESGFSVHMPAAEKEMLIGAPGVFNWKGTSLIYRDKSFNDYNPIASKYRQSEKLEEKLTDTEIFNQVTVGNARFTSQTLAFGYFGYAVTSGYFYSKKRLYYAGGAPRSINNIGQVLIYDFRQNSNLDVKDSKQGTQFGEYFGASLAAGDINNDGLDDLFIGAPFRKTSKYNEGRMYLFLGSKKGTLQEPLQGKFIDGTAVNGQFGTAITYLGAMNKDVFRTDKPKYVAVSAPYEEDSGVVYIYKGNTFGLDMTPAQRIVGSSILPNLKGFGISISKPADIDGNGYEDIAIGAHQSGHMVLLRSKPLVTVYTNFQETPSAIASDVNGFKIVICHRYYVFRGMPSIRISRRIIIDEDFNRASLQNGTKEIDQVTIQELKQTCENITIKLRGSSIHSFDPLTIKVTHKLIEEEEIPEQLLISNKLNGTDHFCQRCGVYDEFRSTQTVTKSIPFVLGCGDDNICISELEFGSRFKGTGVRNNTFILGATNVIELETVVENKGEKAYLLRIQVDLPKGLSFKQTPTLCFQNETKIICPVAHPLNKYEKGSLSLKLDMDFVNKRIAEDFLYINVTVLTSSENKNEASKLVTLNLKTEADISISGKSGEQSYSYDDDNSVEFQQIFQIGKYGLSPISLIRFRLYIPYAIKSTSDTITFISLYQPEGYLDGGQSLIFNSDIPYFEENKYGTSEELLPEENEEIRNRRTTDMLAVETEEGNTTFAFITERFQQETLDFDLLGNRTFEISCNMTEVLCAKIDGTTGPFDGSKKSAVLQLRMRLDSKVLSGFLQENAVIRYSTYGTVEIRDPADLVQTGTKPDMVVVSSLFINDAGKKLGIWIIIVSVVSGLLLLLLLTLALVKAGFFKRTKREELENLKAQTDLDNAETTLKPIDTESSVNST